MIILRGVSFEVNQESVSPDWGQRGPGKSTILRTISGLIKSQLRNPDL